MKLQREIFLANLAEVAVALSRKEILEQSNAFVFSKGNVIAFNDELLARRKCEFGELRTVIPGAELLQVLDRFPDDEMEVVFNPNEVVFEGVKRSVGITTAHEVYLPYKSVPKPGEWSDLPEQTVHHLKQAALVCGNDETMYLTTVVHASPDLIESCDSYRAYRARVKTGFREGVLIPAAILSTILRFPLKSVSMSNGWLHFRTESGTTYSLRASQQDYLDLTQVLAMSKPERIKLPATLIDGLQCAALMTEEGYSGYVDVTLCDNKMTVKARKQGGWFRESRKIKYKGKKLSFATNPTVLVEMLRRSRDVMVSREKLKVEDERVEFAIALRATDGKGAE